MPVVVIQYNRLTGYYGSGGWASGLIAVTRYRGEQDREEKLVLILMLKWFCGVSRRALGPKIGIVPSAALEMCSEVQRSLELIRVLSHL